MKLPTLLAAAGLCALLSGCAAFDYVEPDHPVALAAVGRLERPPRVALVLGSGGPRGYAHLGVLRVLEQAGVEIDLMVGSSVGSLIGAFWAAGYSAQQLDDLSNRGGPLTLFDFSPFADRGWIHGQRLQDYVNDQLRARPLERLPRRLIVVATRRADKAPVFFADGNAGVAVRASSAMPGILSPVGIAGTEYEDADESLPLAVRAARQAGASFVIAVDVSARPGAAPPGTSAAMLARDARRRNRIDPEVALANILIHPPMDYGAGPFRSYFLQARQAGEATAREQLPELLRRLHASGAMTTATPEAPGSARLAARLR